VLVYEFLAVGDLTFEEIYNFKYLVFEINQQTNSHKEIIKGITTENKSYFALVPLFKANLQIRKTKIRLY